MLPTKLEELKEQVQAIKEVRIAYINCSLKDAKDLVDIAMSTKDTPTEKLMPCSKCGEPGKEWVKVDIPEFFKNLK